MPVSIIIPALNEENAIKHLLQQLQVYRQQGHEVIVVDGGSVDQTVPVAESFADKIILSPPGRAVQMNNGANQSHGEILWFLHADTNLNSDSFKTITEAISYSEKVWGRFNIQLSGAHFIFRIIETMMNLRSCLTSIATGDQGIFVKRIAFFQVGGFKEIPLMEDIELSKRLKSLSRCICVKQQLITSSRRWEKNGILKTVLLMWRLRFLYWLGVSEDKLAKQYRS